MATFHCYVWLPKGNLLTKQQLFSNSSEPATFELRSTASGTATTRRSRFHADRNYPAVGPGFQWTIWFHYNHKLMNLWRHIMTMTMTMLVNHYLMSINNIVMLLIMTYCLLLLVGWCCFRLVGWVMCFNTQLSRHYHFSHEFRAVGMSTNTSQKWVIRTVW